MVNNMVTAGEVCIGLIMSRKIQRDILPNHGDYYRSYREHEDRVRFCAFVKTTTADALYNCLRASEPFNLDDFITKLG